MKSAVFCTIPKELTKENIDIVTNKLIKRDMVKFAKKENKKAIPYSINFYNEYGDNFIRNLITVVLKFDLYKVPRFIKR